MSGNSAASARRSSKQATSQRQRFPNAVRDNFVDWLAVDWPNDVRRTVTLPDDLRCLLPAGSPKETMTEAHRRLELLFDTFKIPRGDFQQLAIALACLHVPGFRVPTRRGRPRKIKARPTAAQLAQRLGAYGRPRAGRRRSMSPIELVRAVDTWQTKQKVLTGMRPTDAAWADFALRAEAEKKGLRGCKAKDYVRNHKPSKKKEISNARKWVRDYEAGVRELMSEKLKRNS